MGDRADEFKRGQRQVWSIGDYGAMAEQYRRAADDLVRRLDVRPSMRVLDVCTGTGNAALEAASVGADVVGLDLTPELFDEAHNRADELGLRVDWRQGDAEALPFPEDEFDRVLSVFGLMFTPRPGRACQELLRVLRPGGRFGLCNWALRGAVADVFAALRGTGVPRLDPAVSPMPWGEPPVVRAMFLDADVELDFAWGAVEWMFPSAEEGVRWLEEVSGPFIAAKAAIMVHGNWPAARERLVDAVSSMTREDVAGVWIRAEYLITLGALLG